MALAQTETAGDGDEGGKSSGRSGARPGTAEPEKRKLDRHHRNDFCDRIDWIDRVERIARDHRCDRPPPHLPGLYAVGFGLRLDVAGAAGRPRRTPHDYPDEPAAGAGLRARSRHLADGVALRVIP